MRSELDAVQNSEQLAKRKELWLARKESGSTGATLTGRVNTQFVMLMSEKRALSGP